MPIYEYRCSNCRRKTEVFSRSHVVQANPTCSHCDSGEMSRIFSKFAVRRSKNDSSVYDDILGDRKLTDGLMRNDPRALAEWSRKMGHAADEDSTPETEELMDRLDAGEDVSEVLETMKPPGMMDDGGLE